MDVVDFLQRNWKKNAYFVKRQTLFSRFRELVLFFFSSFLSPMRRSLQNLHVAKKLQNPPLSHSRINKKKPSLTIWVDNFALVYIICHAIFIDVEKCSWILFPLLVSWLVLFFRAKGITESWVFFSIKFMGVASPHWRPTTTGNMQQSDPSSISKAWFL